jgi:hypothetical protein
LPLPKLALLTVLKLLALRLLALLWLLANLLVLALLPELLARKALLKLVWQLTLRREARGRVMLVLMQHKFRRNKQLRNH